MRNFDGRTKPCIKYDPGETGTVIRNFILFILMKYVVYEVGHNPKSVQSQTGEDILDGCTKISMVIAAYDRIGHSKTKPTKHTHTHTHTKERERERYSMRCISVFV